MTSNIGSEEFAKKQSRIGFAMGEDKKAEDTEFNVVKERVLEEMKTTLAPELLNRIDYKIIFRHLDKAMLAKIMKVKLEQFFAVWKANSTIVLPKFGDAKIKEIINKIYDPQYGARPVERYIQDEVEPGLIKKILDAKQK
jgi:ATP-dependent Clp protease ATP-binding subunit ClpC